LEKATLPSHLANLKNAGAGEVMLQSVDRDGEMAGYDIVLLREVASQVSMPLIVAGGAGSFMDLENAFVAGADGAACGSLFNFGDNNPLRAKAFLKNRGVCVKRIG
jgi:cyclase